MAKITKQFKNGYALIIGVGKYLETDVPRLPSAVPDGAEALYELLIDSERAGYPEAQVKLLTDDSATKDRIMEGLDWLGDCVKKNPAATVVVYFSGHGGIKSNQYMLLPYDFAWKNWELSGILGEQFGDKINDLSCSKLLVMLDCCHAAGMTAMSSEVHQYKPSNLALYDTLKKGRGRVVMASSRHDQYSHILDNAPYSAFAGALLAALETHGGNDAGYAMVLRIMAHISDEVKRITNLSQIPVFNSEGLEDFAICRIGSNGNTQQQPDTGSPDPVQGKDMMAAPVADLKTFKNYLVELLDEQGAQAVPQVLEAIKGSSFQYNKPALANLRNDFIDNLALFSMNSYITRVKVFIGTLTPQR